ncbi:MAG: hypothetical protein AAB575_04980 [Patescibacteria group bacterium]
MNEEIIKKLENHDGQLEIIAGTVLRHTEKLDEHAEKLDAIARTVLDHSGRLDRIEHKMEQLATRADHQQIMSAIDNLLKISTKRDHETTSLTYNLRIVDDKVEKHDKDITRIKTTLGLGQIVSG